jgi:signal transduction histidine kinase
MSTNQAMLIIFVAVVALICGLVVFISVMLFVYMKKKAEHDREELRIRMEVQEETTEQISRELHDSVGNELTLAKLQLKAVALEVGGPVGEKISDTCELLTRTLSIVRDISKSLSMDIIRTDGLMTAIQKQLDRLKSASHFEVRFNIHGSYQYMDEKTEMILFRIFQEAINNIVSHACAKVITVAMECTERFLIMTVSDDGVGFQLPKSPQSRARLLDHGGLKNMRARAGLIKGEFNLESQVGMGTMIRISVPVNR